MSLGQSVCVKFRISVKLAQHTEEQDSGLYWCWSLLQGGPAPTMKMISCFLNKCLVQDLAELWGVGFDEKEPISLHSDP